MSFLNDLGKKISGAAEVAADKAKDLAEITKLNYDISLVQKQIESYYTEIGKQMFSSEKDNPQSPVAELCQKILAGQQTVADLNSKIQQLQADGQTNPTASATEPKKFCSNCGAEIIGEGKFCQGCGAPIN